MVGANSTGHVERNNQKENDMTKTALFIVPNPMHPGVRLAGFETRREVKSVVEAETIAEKNGWEFVGMDRK